MASRYFAMLTSIHIQKVIAEYLSCLRQGVCAQLDFRMSAVHAHENIGVQMNAVRNFRHKSFGKSY